MKALLTQAIDHQGGPYALNRGVTCGSTVNRVLGLHLFRRFNRVLTSEFEFGRSLGVKVVVELYEYEHKKVSISKPLYIMMCFLF